MTENVVNYFHVGPSATRVGVATFSSSATVNFRLDDHFEKESLLEGEFENYAPTQTK